MSHYTEVCETMVSRLKEADRTRELDNFHTVITNDFSFDRLVYLNEFKDFTEKARVVLSHGGGVMPDSRQSLNQGGCAANTATALANFGIPTSFIGRTDELGFHLMKFYLEKRGVDISHVKTDGSLALMTGFEIGEKKYNIMINDGESHGGFGFDDLTGEDRGLIQSADLVGVFDWTLNQKGTDLSGRLLDFLEGYSCVTYLDTSDPTSRKDEIPELFTRVLSRKNLSHLNLNENELKHYTGAPHNPEHCSECTDLAVDMKSRISAVLNIHTSRFALSVENDTAVFPTFQLKPLRTTGAGDSWNGGNILGILLGCEPLERLLLANATAAFYVVSETGTRPNLVELAQFIESNKDNLHTIEK